MFKKKSSLLLSHTVKLLFSTSTPPIPKNPILSYLTSNCGLTPDSALSVATKVRLKSTSNPDAVLKLLKNYGFTQTHISHAVAKHPRLLLAKPDKTLKPKLDFLLSSGFTADQVATIVSSNPNIVCNHNLERRLIPSINYIKSVAPSKTAVVDFLKCPSSELVNRQLSNIQVLKKLGVSEASIKKVLISNWRHTKKSPRRFAAAIVRVIELGVDPSSSKFVTAVGLLSYMCKETWDRKVKLYKSLGFQEDEIISIFQRHPTSFSLSDDNIRDKFVFFTEKLGWDREFLVANSTLTHLSLERRIIPRCLVLKVLMEKGLMRFNRKPLQPFLVSNDVFRSVYVDKYKKEVPQVLKAYNGEMAFEGWL